MFCFNTKSYKHAFCCPCCGNKMEKKALQNGHLKRTKEKDRKCSECGEILDENAGKYPQIVVAIVGSRNSDTKGFIVSAIFKLHEFDNKLRIKLCSEKNCLKIAKTSISIASEETSKAGTLNFDNMEKTYKDYFYDRCAQYPAFEGSTPSDRAYIQSYTFKVENIVNGQNALLTIVELNERFLDNYEGYNKTGTRQDALPHVKRILGNTRYTFFLLDPDDAKKRKLLDDVSSFKDDLMRKDALHAIICQNEPESVYMNRDEFEATDMEALLEKNRHLISSKIDLLKRNKANLYFMCSPKEHSDNNGNPLNCELPFYWVLILEGIMDVFVSEHNTRDKYNRIKSDRACWERVEKMIICL